VKLEVALALVLGALVLLTASIALGGGLTSLLIAGGYGIAAMVWLVFRTRRVLRQNRDVAPHEQGEWVSPRGEK
jgi:hypothetical protein